MAVRDIIQAAAGVGGGDKLYVEDVFSTYLYTGNGTSQTITNGIDLDGEGGLVWIKDRNSGAKGHALFDTVRGGDYKLQSQSTNGQFYATNQVTSFNADGFSLGSAGDPNGSGTTYASWTFRKAPKFFDVVTYTGNGTSGKTIAHSLGSVPGCIIVKEYSNAGNNWKVYHRSLGATKFINLSATTAAGTDNTYWNDTEPTSTVFTVGNDASVNNSGRQYVAYLFAHDAGGFGDDGEQNVISCGSYTGNGSATGPTVTLGYEPQWILIKNASGSTNWLLHDINRGLPVGGNYANLIANGSDAEITDSPRLDLLPTGFQIKTTNSTYNTNGSTYIYIAIRRPMKTPESGTEVFAVDYQGTGGVLPGYKAPFPVDMGMWTDRDGGNKQITSRLTNDRLMYANTTDAELGSASYSFDYQNGFMDIATTDTTRVGWMFRRAPGFFDVVAYTGTGVARTVNHNLGVAPELMIVKKRSASGTEWATYSEATGASKFLNLNSTIAATTPSPATGYWNSTAPTSTVFSLGNWNDVNSSGATFIAYLFASLPGVSKVSSYTGTGANLNVDCGFSAGARFVLIKRTDSTGDWYIWDSARGIVSGNDPYLLLNSTAAQNTSTDYIDPLASGFTVTSSAPAALNASGGSYIFLAIA